MIIEVQISLGEFLDKITILELKLEYMEDSSKLKNVEKEYQVLTKALEKSIKIDTIEKLKSELKEINRKLWLIEDSIRDFERQKKFDNKFIELARSVYSINDKRAEVKKNINVQFGSSLVEEKSYRVY